MTLLWVQFIIGANTRLLIRIFPRIIQYHRRQGLFAFLFAFIHPLLIAIAFGADQLISYKFLPPPLRPYAFLGTLALTLLILTAGTALLSKSRFIGPRWRIIHYLNYLVFTLAWLHSWLIGSDIRSTPLRYLWLFFAATAIISLALRLKRAFSPKDQKIHKTRGQPYLGN